MLIHLVAIILLHSTSDLYEYDSNKILSINHSSIGFEYLHTFATMDEVDVPNLTDRFLLVIKQCDFFMYDKLKDLIIIKHKHIQIRKTYAQLNQQYLVKKKMYNLL